MVKPDVEVSSVMYKIKERMFRWFGQLEQINGKYDKIYLNKIKHILQKR